MINDRECWFAGPDNDEISYSQLVKLSGRNPKITYSVTYRSKKKKGTLYPGSAPAQIEPGTVFSIALTNLA